MTDTTDTEANIEPGQRYWDPDHEESLLVVGIEAEFAIIQNEDGSAGDYLIGSPRPEGFTPQGLQLLGTDAPMLEDACESDSHAFGLSPDESGQTIDRAICGRCGLSVQAVEFIPDHLSTKSIPWRCSRCGEGFKGTDPFEFDGDQKVCTDCAQSEERTDGLNGGLL